jgi:hypothetical protein
MDDTTIPARRAELATITKLTNSGDADRRLQELMAASLIDISEGLQALAPTAPGPELLDLPPVARVTQIPALTAEQEADMDGAAFTPNLVAEVAASLAEIPDHATPEQQAADYEQALRPTEKGQRVMLEGSEPARLGTVESFGVSENEPYVVVSWDADPTRPQKVWVRLLLVVTEEPATGADPAQFDVVMPDEKPAKKKAKK